MPLVASSVPNLIAGVSQQADELRYPAQLAEQVNYNSDPVKGLTRRNPSIYAGELFSHSVGDQKTFYHDIQRDSNERYLLSINNVEGTSTSEMFIHDLDGNAYVIKDAGGSAYSQNASGGYDIPTYLDTATPMSSLKAVTVADYTYIVNKGVTTALEAATTTARNPEAILMVKQSRFNATYTVKIWNSASSTGAADHTATYTTKANLTTTNNASPTSNTTDQLESQGDVMDQLVSGLSSPSGYTLTQSGALLHIQRTTSTDFRIEVTCDAPEHLFVFKDEVQDVALLPKEGFNGFEIKVVGDADEEGDEYYVKFQTPENVSVGFSNGSWVETRAQGIQYQLDADTMPMILISNGSDFTLKAATWNDRLVGDDDSNPAPSFIGEKINEIYFYKNRLSFLADEKRIMSESGEFFNFWRTTVTFLKDSDPIDNSNPHTKVSILQHAVPIGGKDNEFVTLWSDKTIFIDSANGLWTPASTSIAPSEEIEVSTLTRPVAINKRIYFTYSTGTFNGVSEYRQDRDLQEYQAERISEQIPNYIQGDIRCLAGSSRLDMLALVATEAPSSNYVYVYKFFEKDGERLQAAWYKFFLGNGVLGDAFGGMLVEYVFFVDTKLYIVSTLGGKIVLSYIDMDTAYTDPNSTVTTYLDMRIDDTQLTSRTYNVITDETEFVVPFEFPTTSTIGVGIRRTSVNDTTSHVEIPVKRVDEVNKKFWVKGDYTSHNLWIGYKYYAFCELTRPTIRNKSGGVDLPIAGGKFYVRKGYLLFDNTRSFDVQLRFDYRPTETISRKAQSINVGNGAISQNPDPDDGTFSIPVFAYHREVVIFLVTQGIFGSSFINLEWEGKYRRFSRLL